VPYPVEYRELLNSDARVYGGSGLTQPGGKASAEEYSSHGFPFSIVLDLPPLGGLVLKPAPLKLE
jgi:1,4-alpha-glucan branching enzyme